MDKPLVVTIEHHSTRAEVLAKIKARFDEIRSQIAPYASSIEAEWTESGVTAQVVTLGQPLASRIDVDERLVRLEVRLPGLLAVLSGLIEGVVRREGPKLLR
jgi:hypothetical protein